MRFLLDTNILLKTIDLKHPKHFETDLAVKTLIQQGIELFISSQNLIEFWNVCTRSPEQRQGLGYLSTQTKSEVDNIRRQFYFLPETEEVYEKWEILAIKYNLKTARLYDNRLVAFMLAYEIENLLTHDVDDFSFDSEILVKSPKNIIDEYVR